MGSSTSQWSEGGWGLEVGAVRLKIAVEWFLNNGVTYQPALMPCMDGTRDRVRASQPHCVFSRAKQPKTAAGSQPRVYVVDRAHTLPVKLRRPTCAVLVDSVSS